MVFVCRVTLQDYVIKELNDFMVRSPTRYFTILPSLLAIGTVAVEIYIFSLSRDFARLHDQKTM